MGVPSVLQEILALKAAEVTALKSVQPQRELQARARDLPPPRGFAAALEQAASHGPAVIAEVKKASPSQGVIREDFDPPAIARAYADSGAAALSVLTERERFLGHPDFLVAARGACALPALRKDFIADEWQVWETRVMGADAILLIVAALEFERLRDLHALAVETGLDVLVEVHDETELETAMSLSPRLLGVNNRDLNTFDVDLDTSLRLKQRHDEAGGESLFVAESGIHQRDDVVRLQAGGIGAFLVGEALMRQPDPGQALTDLFF